MGIRPLNLIFLKIINNLFRISIFHSVLLLQQLLLLGQLRGLQALWVVLKTIIFVIILNILSNSVDFGWNWLDRFFGGLFFLSLLGRGERVLKVRILRDVVHSGDDLVWDVIRNRSWWDWISFLLDLVFDDRLLDRGFLSGIPWGQDGFRNRLLEAPWLLNFVRVQNWSFVRWNALRDTVVSGN